VVYARRELLDDSLNQRRMRRDSVGEDVRGVGNSVKKLHRLLSIKQFRNEGRAGQAGKLGSNLAAAALRVVSDSLAWKQRFFVQG
jgi:hypothetical protein